MNESDIERWVEAYVKAWESNDPTAIRAVFTEDARYFTAPYREPWSGGDEIVKEWLGRKDEQGTWTFRSEVMAVAGSLGFVRGWTVYDDATYSNLWVIRLADDGRCEEFTEWWMKEK
jgi:ketosteroid isomerase-like protein